MFDRLIPPRVIKPEAIKPERNPNRPIIPTKPDSVSHPQHYNREGAMECIDEMVLLFGVEETKSFCKLNAYKYRYRAADKGGDEDLRKSDWYIRKYKELSSDTVTLYCDNTPHITLKPTK